MNKEMHTNFVDQAFTVPHAGGWGHAPGTPESGAPVPSDGEDPLRGEWDGRWMGWKTNLFFRD